MFGYTPMPVPVMMLSFAVPRKRNVSRKLDANIFSSFGLASIRKPILKLQGSPAEKPPMGLSQELLVDVGRGAKN